MSNNWVAVNLDGLRKLFADRPKVFILHELISNALDEKSTRVDVTFEWNAKKKTAWLVVEDDNPDGFKDLTHAYTLYADSAKKSNPEQRGRFNMGEKMVLAFCHSAEIITTKGTVRFLEGGGRQLEPRTKLKAGSQFSAEVKMTKKEFEQALADVQHLILGYTPVYVNGVRIPVRAPIREFEATLPTVTQDEEGNLRPTRRVTQISVYNAHDSEEGGWIYEMGIPVVATGDKYNVNVNQKVPLNMNRDNVTPSYLRALRVAVLNRTADLIEPEDTPQTWVKEAISDPNIEPVVVKEVVTQQFGKKVVAFDPSDLEANNRAIAEGYKVVYGRQFNSEVWDNIKRAEVVKPAGQVMPTPKPYSDDPNAPMVDIMPPSEYTDAIRAMVKRLERLGTKLVDRPVSVTIVRTNNGFAACCGQRGNLDLNLKRLGHKWFESYPNNLSAVMDLVIHELGHVYESNHLSEAYYDALTQLGGRMVDLALKNPEMFEMRKDKR